MPKETSFENIEVSVHGPVGVIALHRPKALNALCEALVNELNTVLDSFEANDDIRVMILTGSDKAFAAGADIREIADKTFQQAYRENFVTRNWDRLATCRKPVIAAVAGYALGGGCEFAMMCDFIIAADTAKFGQPEVTIGTLPGAGGTQRLARLIGRQKAMEMCLTGRMMDAQEALDSGLVARVVPADRLMDVALETAQAIAGHSRIAVQMIKESVHYAAETGLAAGLGFERRLFHMSFGTEDQKEGMAAFTEKRAAVFKDN